MINHSILKSNENYRVRGLVMKDDDIFFNAYKSTISPKSPVIVYKNGAFGFNPLNAYAVANLLRQIEECKKIKLYKVPKHKK